jgi:hypothetical protein
MGYGDFRTFGPLKEHPPGERLVTDVDVKQAVTSWLHLTPISTPRYKRWRHGEMLKYQR